MYMLLLPPPQNKVLVEVLFLVASVCLSVCVQDSDQTIVQIATKITLNMARDTPSR